jgi:uncharacterized protein (TIGR02246 family)
MTPAQSILTRVALVVFAAYSLGCAPDPAPEVDLGAEVQAIRALDAGLSAAAQNRDPEAFGAFFAEDAVQLPPSSPPLHGRTAIQENAAGLLGAGADLRFESLEVRVSGSGDMAFSRGMYYLALETPAGPIRDEGSYLEVWEKAGGEWRITVDIYNSDLPAG